MSEELKHQHVECTCGFQTETYAFNAGLFSGAVCPKCDTNLVTVECKCTKGGDNLGKK